MERTQQQVCGAAAAQKLFSQSSLISVASLKVKGQPVARSDLINSLCA